MARRRSRSSKVSRKRSRRGRKTMNRSERRSRKRGKSRIRKKSRTSGKLRTIKSGGMTEVCGRFDGTPNLDAVPKKFKGYPCREWQRKRRSNIFINYDLLRAEAQAKARAKEQAKALAEAQKGNTTLARTTLLV